MLFCDNISKLWWLAEIGKERKKVNKRHLEIAVTGHALIRAWAAQASKSTAHKLGIEFTYRTAFWVSTRR